MKSLYLKQYDAIIRYHQIPGNGSPLVFVAGLNFSSIANFMDIASHPLIRERGALIVDYLGAGHSETTQNIKLSLQDHASTIAAVLDKEGLTDCVLVGFSMGGTVGILLAKMRPDLISHLIVFEANILPGGGDGTKLIASYDEEIFVASVFPEMLADLRRRAVEGDAESAILSGGWGISDPRGIHASSVALVELDDDFAAGYFTMDVRRTFLVGELSLPMNSEAAKPDAPLPEQLRAHGIEVIVVPNVGHFGILTEPDLFTQIFANCLRNDAI